MNTYEICVKVRVEVDAADFDNAVMQVEEAIRKTTENQRLLSVNFLSAYQVKAKSLEDEGVEP